MELHNTIEDIVIPRVEEIYDTIEKEGNTQVCTCNQCRIDTACYVLNRITPHYVVSNRGVARIHGEALERQQLTADITTLVHQGMEKIQNHQRPNINHDPNVKIENDLKDKPVFIIPTITGRVFDGGNFAPISGASIKLLFNGAPAVMKDSNWQNPLVLESHTEGVFSFWPIPVLAEKSGEELAFEYVLQIEAEGYETLNHVFKIPALSETIVRHSFSLERTFKLQDLFLFPVGKAEQDLYLDVD